MKISSFRIRNFSSIADTNDIDCKNMMVFIGRNNAGKSNILKALDIFFNASKPDSNDIPYFTQNGYQIEISVSFENIGAESKGKLGISSDSLTFSKGFCLLLNIFAYLLLLF